MDDWYEINNYLMWLPLAALNDQLISLVIMMAGV